MTQEERNTNKLQWELRIQTFQDSGLRSSSGVKRKGPSSARCATGCGIFVS